MRLYHFTTQQYGTVAVQTRRLKIARIDKLNDPFELLGYNLRDAGTRATLKQWKDTQNAEYGILCFSRKWSNPLLWGHYADKHAGMALGFDVSDGDLYRPVKYLRERLPMPSSLLLEANIDDLLLTKFSAWRYESEYRSFYRLAHSIRDGPHYFVPFSDTLTLAHIIVGDRATITRAELADALGDQRGKTEAFKARPAYGSFKVVENLNKTLWK